MKKYLYISVLISLPLLLISAVKNDFSGMLEQYLADFNKKTPFEKAYVQTDKTYYKPSEYILYNGYLVNAIDNKASVTSDVIYVELRDPWGNTVQKHEHKTLSGNYNGEFLLNSEIAGGLYKLIAYTNWMKNWGEEVFFTKEITVQKVITPRLLLKLDFERRAYGPGDEVVANLKVTDLDNINTTGSDVKSTVRIGGKVMQTLQNETDGGEAAIRFTLPQNLDTSDGILQIIVSDKGIEESITRSIPIVLDKISLSFYPEGGDLIQGVSGKVAFEGLNEFGKGADVSGEITDNNGNIITTFESFHLGMGAFDFIPQAGKSYYARITKPIGSNNPIPLPQAKETGYTLHLKSKSEKRLQWSIHTPKDATVNFVGQTQGKIYYHKSLRLNKGLNTIDVNIDEFPIGIAVFTLFDDKNTETCERLIFINPDKGLHIKLETNKEIYAPSENVKLNIKTTDKYGEPVSASLGIAVVDEQLLTMADDKQDNILSYLLFSSELKGKIQEPNFYFDDKEPKAKEAIDYLMLTHGWRRFTWSEVLNPTTNKIMEHFAEKVSSVYGYVLSANGKPTQADVYLIESGGRIGKVRTTREGHFVFHNTDFTKELIITTKLPNKIHILKGKPEIAQNKSQKINTEVNIVDAEINPSDEGITDMNISAEPKIAEVSPENSESLSPNDFSSFESAAQLDEVVVVGYGVQQKRSLTSSVSVVRETRDEILINNNSITSNLAGAVPGLMVQSRDTNPGESQNIWIRGISTFSSGSGPLVIIDGVAASEPYSSAISFVNPANIESISVLKNASATAIYGSRGANGVILIETKSATLRERFKAEKGNYTGVVVPKRQFYKSPVYHQRVKNPQSENSTVFWTANLRTDKNGTATLSFTNNKQSSTFRITAEGISENGLIGAKSERIVTQKPLAIDAKTPLFAGMDDIIKIPVMVRNSTDKPMDASVQLKPNLDLYVVSDEANNNQIQNITVPAGESKTIYFSLKATQRLERLTNFKIYAKAGKFSDEINRSIHFRSTDFPLAFNFSGKDMGQNKEFILPEYIPNTLKAEAVSYINVLEELFDGVESIFREPYGCFEQVSSSTFPNIFALQLLKEDINPNKEIEKKALKYLQAGYNKLAAYEVKRTGGFEWYGGSPAHEVLSAYGLVEFYEMGKVYNNVDQKMMERTREFILSRKDNNGGFKQNNGRYGFSGAPKNVNNAYIVYALTETKNCDQIESEYKHALNEAFSSKDLYRMALMANAAYNMKDIENYQKLITAFKEYSVKNDFSKIKIDASIVRSWGDANQRETVAFWIMALLKNKDSLDTALIEECLQFILKGRKNGSFGNTQATSICLQALTKYAQTNKSDGVKGSFCLNVNGENGCIDLMEMSKKVNKVKFNFADKLLKGSNVIQLKYTDEPYPYAVNISWRSKVPATSKICPLKLHTHLASNDMKVNETVRLSVKLQNIKKEGLPMSVAILGIPGGLSLQPWQLKELQDKEVFDFYEIINDNLVIYYRELGPAETKTINLDLKAEIPGTYTGIASSAYVYYMNEHKYWINGMTVNVSE